MNYWHEIIDIAAKFFAKKLVIPEPVINDEILSLRSEFADKLKLLQPRFGSMIIELIFEARKAGLNVGLFHGYRSHAHQRKLYAKGRTAPGRVVTRARAGYSWHNFGLAVDIVFYTKKGNWSWAEKNNWEKLGLIGKSIGLKWGGDWIRRDRPHFMLKGKVGSIRKARELFKIGGLKTVWDYV